MIIIQMASKMYNEYKYKYKNKSFQIKTDQIFCLLKLQTQLLKVFTCCL